jgi:hypothetical protein
MNKKFIPLVYKLKVKTIKKEEEKNIKKAEIEIQCAPPTPPPIHSSPSLQTTITIIT